MKFTSIPENGSSWYDKLLYGIDTELTKPSDVHISVTNAAGSIVYGTMVLRGVITAEFNIAPILRNMQSLTPCISRANIPFIAKSALNVQVVANSVVSDTRTFGRIKLNIGTPECLSTTSTIQHVARGEYIFLSLYAPTAIGLRQHITTPTGVVTKSYALHTNGKSIDFAYPTCLLDEDATMVEFEFTHDAKSFATLRYKITVHDNSARQLVWYDRNGALASYVFPKSRIKSIEAEVERCQTTNKGYNRLHKATITRELRTALEPEDEVERIAEIVCSPYVYMVTANSGVKEVELKTRSLNLDTSHPLRQLNILIAEEQKGGIR